MAGRKFYYSMQILGISFLALALAGDLVRYLMMDVMDRAFIMRIGFLLFIICFGAGSIYRLMQLVVQGLHTELISKLAYTDGLTEVGNRTAFMERMDSLCAAQKGNELVIVVFDINSLKDTNDTLGHSIGDALICTCVEIINKTFGTLGDLYRIGGDEFTSFIVGDNAEEQYETMIPCFEAMVKEYNDSGIYPYTISVAYGMATCDITCKEELMKVHSQADYCMYENKRKMKEQG